MRTGRTNGQHNNQHQSSCQWVCTSVLLRVWTAYERAPNLLCGTSGNSKMISERGHTAHQSSMERVRTVLHNGPGLLLQPSFSTTSVATLTQCRHCVPGVSLLIVRLQSREHFRWSFSVCRDHTSYTLLPQHTCAVHWMNLLSFSKVILRTVDRVLYLGKTISAMI